MSATRQIESLIRKLHDAEAERDAAVRAAEQAQEALRQIIDLPTNEDPVHIARAALTGERTE